MEIERISLERKKYMVEIAIMGIRRLKLMKFDPSFVEEFIRAMNELISDSEALEKIKHREEPNDQKNNYG